MVLHLSEDEVKGLLTMDDAISVTDELFRQEARGHAENKPTIELSPPPRGMFRLKAGGNYYMNKFGFKGYGGGGGRRLVFVYDLQQGLEAIVDSIYLTQLRTAAVSAVATRYMARPEATTLGIIGTGKEARTQLEAINKVRPLKHVKAYSRSAENRENFAREMSERTGVPVEPVEFGEECVRNVDIATTITSASEPVLFGAWLAEGTHINGIGATTMFRRELDEEAVARSTPVVVEHLPQAEAELGQLIYAAARGKLRWPLVRELKDVVSGLIPGRGRPEDVTLFTSIGVGTEDVAIAAHVVELARQREVGTVLDM
jgi:ornithine cyclodeaminase/alanine dehydrogenase-like protein (mu-crystallin family)